MPGPFRRRPDLRRRALIGVGRLACRAHQPVGLDRDARVLELRPQREADHHEGEAEQRADDGDAAVGVAVALKKGWF
ncbi:hypothetical protein BJS_09019 [Bradyrhizobium japonicum SEMIA 5079]|nr:hypothetical protein BJS_09019 [Bradyrhizobium japonicum SEMIA 5079]